MPGKSALPTQGKRRWNRGERRRVAYFWRWRERRACHGSVMPCQYVDDANDNHGGWTS